MGITRELNLGTSAGTPKYRIREDLSKRVDVLGSEGPYSTTVYRIEAQRNFGDIKVGDLGGFVESYANLHQEGSCWIYNDAVVVRNARIMDDAAVLDTACVCDYAMVVGRALVSGKARITGFAQVLQDAKVCGHAYVGEHVRVSDSAFVTDEAFVTEDAKVCENAVVSGNASISCHAHIFGNAVVTGHAQVCDRAQVFGNAKICDLALVGDVASVEANTIISRQMVVEYGSEEPLYWEYDGSIFCSVAPGKFLVRDRLVSLDSWHENWKHYLEIGEITHLKSEFISCFNKVCDHFNRADLKITEE